MFMQAFLVICMVSLGESTSQHDLNAIGLNLKVNYVVTDNFEEFGNDYYVASLTLTNTGHDVIPGGDWRVYFTSVQMIEPDFLKSGGNYTDRTTLLSFIHEKGYLFSFGPVEGFNGIKSGEHLQVKIKTAAWSVSRYEQMPNWYVAAPGLQAAVLSSTAGESMDFVGQYTKPNQYKRFINDQYQPWSPEMRYARNVNNMGSQHGKPPVSPIIPTPMVHEIKDGNSVRFSGQDFAIVSGSDDMRHIANYFTREVRRLIPKFSVHNGTQSQGMYILLQTGGLNHHSQSSDAYMLDADGVGQSIKITGASASGVFYGVISLLQLLKTNQNAGSFPGCRIVDWPRFEYRGMMVDTARNFRTKDSLLRLLEVMAMYKLNKFHFHLTDDEGWRLEIPGLPELTQLGGRRCHDPDETKCIMSTLGSGPDNSTSGSGFYTVDEYKEILQFAADRHIQVIPEIDMPGHVHSAIRAMKARKLNRQSSEYDLVEEGDPSKYLSVQFYRENAINPCMNSSYRFIEKVFSEVKKMHEGIQPLKVYHFGGDEVAHGAWENSSACIAMKARGDNLKEEFTRRVSAITQNLTLGAWEDGLMAGDGKPWKREYLQNDDVIAYAWQNIWEWGGGRRAYDLANEGYKVVLSAATEFYFDQPQEPSPDERGFYWATRYTDTHKTFKFMPDDYFMNAETKRSGEAITLAEICGDNNVGCPTLNKPENIIGIQGHLWSETVRKSSHFDYMVFPRLLALAERAWHKADWEGKDKTERQTGLLQDWARFSRLLGGHHLAILDALEVEYRVPPPGARHQGNKIVVNVEFPGLPTQYQIRDMGSSHWHDTAEIHAMEDGQKVAVRTSNPSKTRFSQEVVVTVAIDHEDVHSAGTRKLIGNVWFVVIFLMIMIIY